MLECSDISAADLRVTSKFNSWDTMACRLLIECDKPLVAWSSKMKSPVHTLTKKLVDVDDFDAQSSAKPEPEYEYLGIPQESCMVKATFDIKDLNTIRDILHDTKISKLRDRNALVQAQKNGLRKDEVLPVKIREGLPEWVNYIPAHLYTRSTRKTIEYILMTYTLLTLMWAMWQLYKHVDFIRQYLKPFVHLIEYYLALLKGMFRWLDGIADYLSGLWWKYMKPFYMLLGAALAPLAQIFKPLRNIRGMVSMFVDPAIKLFGTVQNAIKPMIQPVMSMVDVVIVQGMRRGVNAMLQCWGLCVNSQFVTVVVNKFRDSGITRIVHEVTHGIPDPVKAQFLHIRDILLKSSKQIFYGMRFIMSRMYYMVVFVKREQRYAEEGQVVTTGGPPVGVATGGPPEGTMDETKEKFE